MLRARWRGRDSAWWRAVRPWGERKPTTATVCRKYIEVPAHRSVRDYPKTWSSERQGERQGMVEPAARQPMKAKSRRPPACY
jgi:hypothetical protein